MTLRYIGFTLLILGCQAWTIHSQCQQLNASSGIIADRYEVTGYAQVRRCWKIVVPAKHFINISIELPKFISKDLRNCDYAYLQVNLQGVGGTRLCSIEESGKQLSTITTQDSNFDIEFYVHSSKFNNDVNFSFHLKFVVLPSIFGIEGVEEAREKAIKGLKGKYSLFWGWKENTPRAITALSLSGGAQFNGSLSEELMAKQAELRTALSLTWNSVSTQRLSTFINALLTTCLNPRHFYAHDLVDKLKMQVESSGNFTHPIAYLALCNANETWPLRSTADLTNIMTSELDYHLVRDIQAYAIMALSCEYRRNNFSDAKLKSIYFEAIKEMKRYQRPDGSFGNPHTTALFTQALIASDQEFATDWKMSAAIRYLMQELNATDVNFLLVYSTLPLLNRKTLADVSRMDCTNNPRKEGEDIVSQIKDNRGPKIRVQYSLYIGDQKDVIHSLSLRVPTNSTVYQVMELASDQDKKFEVKAETIDEIKHVYEIAGIANDPEEGKFWLLYVKRKNMVGLSESISNPNAIILEDGDHIIMWYKNQEI